MKGLDSKTSRQAVSYSRGDQRISDLCVVVVSNKQNISWAFIKVTESITKLFSIRTRKGDWPSCSSIRCRQGKNGQKQRPFMFHELIFYIFILSVRLACRRNTEISLHISSTTYNNCSIILNCKQPTTHIPLSIIATSIIFKKGPKSRF